MTKFHAVVSKELIEEIKNTYLYTKLEDVRKRMIVDYDLSDINIKLNELTSVDKIPWILKTENHIEDYYVLLIEKDYEQNILTETLEILTLKEFCELYKTEEEHQENNLVDFKFPKINHIRGIDILKQIDNKMLTRVQSNYISQLKEENKSDYQELEEVELYVPKIKGNNRSKSFRKLSEHIIDVDYKRYKNKKNKKRSIKSKYSKENNQKDLDLDN